MNNDNPHQSFEHLASAAKQAGLTASEREAMHEHLRDYRTFHPIEQKQLRLLERWHVGRVLVAASLAILVIAVPLQAQRALPGEPLYVVKVDMVEPLIGTFYLSEYEQIRYETSLLNRRLYEAHRLQQVNRYTEASAVVLGEEVQQRTAEITALVTDSREDAFVATSSLRALTDAVSVVRAHQYVEDRALGDRASSSFDIAAAVMQDTLTEQTQTFTKQSDEQAITDYITETLAEIADTVVREAESVEDVAPELADYLDDIAPAIEADAYETAIRFAHEAAQLVDTEVAIDALEDTGDTREASPEVIENNREEES